MSAVPAPTPAAPSSPPPGPWYADLRDWGRWLRAEPARLALTAGLVGALAFFFGVAKLFSGHRISTFRWAWEAWNPETNYEHAVLVGPIALVLLWLAMPRLRGLRPSSSRWGLAVLGCGVALFLVAARTLQPRVALAALPVVLMGAVLYVWGTRAARILRFPIGFLLFMIPLPGLEQATVKLQVISTQGAAVLCRLIGLHMRTVGTTLQAADNSFEFEIAGGCSGINSLMAITMLTAIFVHLTQDRVWKKLVLLALSTMFAVIANLVRLTSIMVVAKFFGKGLAGGKYHDVSAFVVSLPIAFGAMWLASKVVNWQPTPEQRDRWLARSRPGGGTSSADPAAAALTATAAGANPRPAAVVPRSRPSSAYDY